MTRALPALLLGTAILLAACSSHKVGEPAVDPFQARKVADDVRPSADLVAQANNAFAFDLYRQVRTQPGNLFLSPFSISTALAMTWAGARGTTEAEMAHVLHFPASQEPVHAGYRAVLASLNTGAGLGGYELSTANRLWGQRGFEFLAPFLTITRESYGAALEELDFVADSEGSRQSINHWVESETHDRIKELIQPGVLSAATRLVLTNAIYYKGSWQTTFDPKDTRDASFRVDKDRSVTVPMMHLKTTWKVGGDDEAQVLELPYSGRDLSMLVILPGAPGGLDALEARVNADLVDRWRQGLHEEEMDVFLPRFTVTSSFGLNGALAGLGMPSAFNESADFTGMRAEGGLFIQAVVHKAFVTVNEEGTEAAAATAVVIGVVSVPPAFRADHPFLFLIRDNVTGSILFLGRVIDPTPA